jgi:hypothetical protein
MDVQHCLCSLPDASTTVLPCNQTFSLLLCIVVMERSQVSVLLSEDNVFLADILHVRPDD